MSVAAATRALALSGLLVLCGLIPAAAARAEVACPAGARCDTLTMPLDRGDPLAGTVDVAYALLPHTDASRPALGTVAPNPGGPGSPTIADANTWTGLLGPLRRHFDLLLIDARGTGESSALPFSVPGSPRPDQDRPAGHRRHVRRRSGNAKPLLRLGRDRRRFRCCARCVGDRQAGSLGAVVGDPAHADLRSPPSRARSVDRAERRPADRVRPLEP
jgi:hypothetical protein